MVVPGYPVPVLHFIVKSNVHLRLLRSLYQELSDSWQRGFPATLETVSMAR